VYLAIVGEPMRARGMRVLAALRARAASDSALAHAVPL
jgi:hypothetical protein